MVAYLRFLVRSVPVNGGLNTHKPTVAAIARSVFHRYPKTWSCPGQRSLHSDRAPNAAPTNQAPIEQTFTIDLPRPRVALDSDWRHPRFGFAAADLSHLIYMKLPQAVTEKDVKVLIAKAGLQTWVDYVTASHHSLTQFVARKYSCIIPSKPAGRENSVS